MLTVQPIAFIDPLTAFAPLADRPHAVLLDSAASGGGTGRWSYIAVDPYAVVRADAGNDAGDPFDAVRCLLPRLNSAEAVGPAPFRTGLIGFFGYELGRHLERLPTPHPPTGPVPDLLVGAYDTVAAFDRLERRAWVFGSGLPERDPAARRARAARRVEALAQSLGTTPLPEPPPPEPVGLWQADFGPAEHARRVARVIDYIRAGDIFQANLTQRFRTPQPPGLSGFDIYRRLRALAPAPFAAFLNGGDHWLASVSPERFIALDADGCLETRPIKGTRPRHADPAADAAEAAELTVSVKDRAENLMIVDLLRNDLGRVSRIGSVKVPTLCGLESFATVHHLVSVIEGRLRPGLDAVDVLRATFPGGSITGAPKIRAMEIIHELEPARRGPYCGCIAWLGIDCAMDSSIVIRTLIGDGATVTAQAGGGIVSDSDPAAEYQETRVKVAPLLATLGRLGGADVE
jgi:para-aminobenzoate synthetase component 1